MNAFHSSFAAEEHFTQINASLTLLPQTVALPAKIQAPRLRSCYVDRPALITHLQFGLEGDVTLLSAPTGSGKTSLLSYWLSTNALPSAWLALEPEDNDPTRFLSYFIAALQALHPHIGNPALALLQTANYASLTYIMSTLCDEIAGHSISRFVFVCDDYHSIQSPAIHDAMCFLLEHLPPQMHLIISTRTDPPFPLTRLRARGRLTELRTAELRLSTEEINTFLYKTTHLTLDEETLAAIAYRTEGWIAGVHFAALSLRGHRDTQQFLRSFHGSHRFVLDYINEEVLFQQPASVQDFLLATSILRQFNASLCNAVLMEDNAQIRLEALEQDNLFIIPLDNTRQWYRYHHLFAEALRTRLQQSQPERAAILHLRASQWYEQQGFVIEAVRHAFLAQDMQYVAELLERHSGINIPEPPPNIRPLIEKGVSIFAEQRIDHLLSIRQASEQPVSINTLSSSAPPHQKAPLTLVEPLSEREVEVLRLLARGATNNEIAEQLIIAISTVKRHVTNLLAKLNANNRTQAVAEARELGLL